MAGKMKTAPTTPTSAPSMRFITPKQLQQMMEENPSAIQVVDSRSFMNYNMERIIGSVNVYCPPLVKRRFQTCLPLNTMLTPETKLTLCRPTVESIVVHDQCTDEVLYHLSQTDLPLVIHSLAQFLGDKNYLVLAGGYCRFRQEYPNLCSSHTSLSGQLRHVTRNGSPKNGINPVSPSSLSALNLVASKSHPILSLTPVELLPHLYIGDAGHSRKRELLKRLNITTILNVSTSCENHFPFEFRYKVIPVEDSSNANLLEWFQDAILFIEHERRNGGKVLVHCHGGISRSATVCLAYLMYTRQWRLNDAFDYVKSRRHMISPNANFLMQLSQFENELRSLGFGQLPPTFQNKPLSPDAFMNTPLSPKTFINKPLSPIRLFTFASCPDMGQYHLDMEEGNENEIEDTHNDNDVDHEEEDVEEYDGGNDFLHNNGSVGNTNEINNEDRADGQIQNGGSHRLGIHTNNNDEDFDFGPSTSQNVTVTDNNNCGVQNNDNDELTNTNLDPEMQTVDKDEAAKNERRPSSANFPHLTSNNVASSFCSNALASPT